MPSLLLSGWTQPIDALRVIDPEGVPFDYSAYPSPEASFAGLEQFKHTKSVIAWSMGGQLALRAIAAGVLKPEHLTLIATPHQFVGKGGMDPITFEQFRTNYATNAARTKTRFHGLVAKGDRDFNRVLDMLGHHPEVENTARWLPWLDDLATSSLLPETLAHVPSTLIVHGAQDHIVPIAQGEWLAHHLPNVTFERWEEAGHAPHLHDSHRLKTAIATHRLTKEAA
jgi:pimeloyl-ACP methyl ester carboxylesterase